MLNGQNLLSVTKVICRQSLSKWIDYRNHKQKYDVSIAPEQILCELSLDFVFIPTHNSSVAKFTARKELKWR